MTTQVIDTSTLTAWLGDGKELAVLDIRAPEVVGYASPLFATNLPAERVLGEIDRFVPRKVTRTVLVDDGSGTAVGLAKQLALAGRTNVVALEGGIPAWVGDGSIKRPTFDTPGVDFVLKIKDERGTPAVTVEEVKRLREAGEDFIILDSRTVPEFTKDHVPGAVSVPGAELVLRFADVVPSPTTKVFVSCAGLPRAIIGAQTLIDAGVPNPVAYLHDGTKAWREAGWELETGKTAAYGEATEKARDFAAEHIEALAEGDDFPEIDLATARRLAADPARTTYLLDVRTPEEYADNHLPGTLSSEGGQLLGVAYRTIAVRSARVVLIDDLLGVRARTTAHWLQRRGYEIALLLHDFTATEAAVA
jgi:rhodanese-related sulfurtransferase